jgi:hypothetical protein
VRHIITASSARIRVFGSMDRQRVSDASCARSAEAGVLEPYRTAVFAVQPCLAIREAASNAALALGGVGAVEEGDVLISDIAEPTSLLR